MTGDTQGVPGIIRTLKVSPSQARVTSQRASRRSRLLSTSVRLLLWLFHRRQNCCWLSIVPGVSLSSCFVFFVNLLEESELLAAACYI